MSLGELTRVLEELEEAVDGLLGRLERASDAGEEQVPSARDRRKVTDPSDTGSDTDEAAELIRRAIKRLTSLY
jgi:hypothetical protein